MSRPALPSSVAVQRYRPVPIVQTRIHAVYSFCNVFAIVLSLGLSQQLAYPMRTHTYWMLLVPS